jgi:hypothetical protein
MARKLLWLAVLWSGGVVTVGVAAFVMHAFIPH